MLVRHCVKMFGNFRTRHLSVFVVQCVEAFDEETAVNEDGNLHGR